MTPHEYLEAADRDAKFALRVLLFFASLLIGWCVFALVYTLLAVNDIVPPLTVELIKSFFG